MSFKNRSISGYAAVLVLLVTLVAPIQARADAVSDWSSIANTVFSNAGRPGGAAAVDFAYVHAAIYDAVNAIDGHYAVYAVRPSSSPAYGLTTPGGEKAGISISSLSSGRIALGMRTKGEASSHR